ncbi:MAG: hypothetical protein QOH47_833 [Sphingomonadales bacterium]|nr:hypothetical protein [Sphingomonadales bacterium]
MASGEDQVGLQTGPPTTEEEALLALFRKLPPDAKAQVMRAAEGALQTAQGETPREER